MASTIIDRAAGAIGSTAMKSPVRVATTANITLSGLQTIDGVTVAADDRVLVKDQTDASENGIYAVSSTAWSRATDFDGAYDAVNGTVVYVRQGSAGQGFWYCTATDPFVIGTDDISFAQASSVLAVVSAFAQTLLDDADGAAVLTTLINSATAATAMTTLLAPSFLRGYLGGLTLSNNATTPNTKVDVAVGSCADDTNTVFIKLTASGTIDFSTTGANGLDTGSIGASKTYHIYAIAKADGTAARLASLSVSAPTLPTGYVYQRRIGSVLTDASSHIRAFKQDGDRFLLVTPTADIADSAVVTSSRTTIALAGVPSGVRVLALLNANVFNTGGASYIYFTSLDQTDQAPSRSGGLVNIGGDTTSDTKGGQIEVMTDSSRQIGYRATAVAGSVQLNATTRGWVDTRGRFA